MLMLTDKRNRP